MRRNNLPVLTEHQKQLALKALNTTNFDELPLNVLVDMFKSIDHQYQLVKGQILLSARNRFGEDDRGFGIWIKENGLDTESQQQRHKYMALARHFSNRSMSGLTPSVCMELAVAMDSKSDEVKEYGKKLYNEYMGKNPSKLEILSRLKTVRSSSRIPKRTPVFNDDAGYTLPESSIVNSRTGLREMNFTQADIPMISPKESILSSIRNLPYDDQIELLFSCITEIEAEKAKKAEEFLNL